MRQIIITVDMTNGNLISMSEKIGKDSPILIETVDGLNGWEKFKETTLEDILKAHKIFGGIREAPIGCSGYGAIEDFIKLEIENRKQATVKKIAKFFASIL